MTPIPGARGLRGKAALFRRARPEAEAREDPDASGLISDVLGHPVQLENRERLPPALAEAGPVAERLQAAGDTVLTEPRSVQVRVLAERGAHEQAPAADELVATAARETGEPQA